jgi:hypothetical protein
MGYLGKYWSFWKIFFSPFNSIFNADERGIKESLGRWVKVA